MAYEQNKFESPVLTGGEVAHYLRLCTPDDGPDAVGKAIRCIHRLVRQGKLRPIKPGREYLFLCSEVHRYAVDETNAQELTQSGASV